MRRGSWSRKRERDGESFCAAQLERRRHGAEDRTGGDQQDAKSLVLRTPGGRSTVGGDEASSGTTCSLQRGVSALVMRCSRPSRGQPSRPTRGGEPGPAMKGEKFDRTMVMTLAFFLSNGSLPVLQRPLQT